MTQVLDSVPIRVAPLPGEAIDSWLEAYARRLQCTVRELLALAAVPSPTRAAWASRPWTAATSPDEFAAISVLTGVAVEQLDAMTWGRFDGTVVTLAPSARRHGPARWWPHLSGSRFCPDCLADTAGRWMLAWRLPWAFACTEHRRLLADLCDTCERRPRANWVAHKSLRGPADRCRTSSPGIGHPGRTATGGAEVCGRSLSRVATGLLPADGLVVSAARQLTATIGDAATARTADAAMTTLDTLHAVARSCLRAYARSTPDELPGVVRETLAELDIEPTQPIEGPSARFGPRDHQARTIAFAVTLASKALSSEHNRLDPLVAAWLARHEIPTSGFGNPDGMIKRWAVAERGIQQAMLRAAAPRLGAVNRLRYQVDGPTPAAPIRQGGLSRASQVPGLFWPGWSLRLNTGMHDGQCLPFRTALSNALVLIGSDAEIGKVYEALGRAAATSMGKSLSWLVSDLKTEEARHDFLAALCHLAASLDTHGSPIDYARRRELFTTVELDIDLLREYFDHAGLRLPSDGMIRHYRLRVAELLTGHHPQYRPTPAIPKMHHSKARTYEEATLRNTGAVSAHLEDQAQRILKTAGINEPVTWEPPFAWIPELTWPGPHPDDLDIATLWKLLREGQKPAAVARALGTSAEHVWVAALRHPEAAGQGPTPRGGNLKIPRAALPDADQIRRAHERGLTIKDLADQSGHSYTMIKKRAAAYGIAFPTGGQRAFVIDPEWLRDQLEPQQRTLKEISEELGIASAHLAELARELNITIRGRGSHNSRHPLTPYGGPQAFTPQVWSALQGEHGIERVRRFLATTQHATLSQAAAHFGITGPNLHEQLDVLERRTNTQLFERKGKSKRRTATLTAAGHSFSHDARHALALLEQPPPHNPPTANPPIRWLRGGPKHGHHNQNRSPVTAEIP